MSSKFYKLGRKEAKSDPEGGCIAFVGWDDKAVEMVNNFGALNNLLQNSWQFCNQMAGEKECSDKITPHLEKECITRNLNPFKYMDIVTCDWIRGKYFDQWLLGCAEYIEEEILRESG